MLHQKLRKYKYLVVCIPDINSSTTANIHLFHTKISNRQIISTSSFQKQDGPLTRIPLAERVFRNTTDRWARAVHVTFLLRLKTYFILKMFGAVHLFIQQLYFLNTPPEFVLETATF
jgi:hypothetical protein